MYRYNVAAKIVSIYHMPGTMEGPVHAFNPLQNGYYFYLQFTEEEIEVQRG